MGVVLEADITVEMVVDLDLDDAVMTLFFGFGCLRTAWAVSRTGGEMMRPLPPLRDGNDDWSYLG